MIYLTSTVHAPSHDTGVRWNSFGFDWGTTQPLSQRDAGLPAFDELNSPF
jgi:dTDP-4-dehydrorhamnose 3,5-epimerase-like enzyme